MGLSTEPSAYTPQPGTIPARVVDYFSRHMLGHEVQTGVLVDELDQPSASITSSCQLAVMAGLIKVEKREGRLYWSRGPGAPSLSLLEVPAFLPPQLARAERRAAMTPAASERVTINTPRPVQLVPVAEVPESVPPSQPNPAPRAEPEAAPAPPPAGPNTAESGAACAPAAPECHIGTSTALTPPAPMRCAVWSDGTLAIEKDGRTQTYTREETKAIVRYLERVLIGEGAEC